MSKITPLDLDSIAAMFEAGDWKTLELRFGSTELFLSKLSGASPSWNQMSPTSESASTHSTPVQEQRPAREIAAPDGFDIPAGHVLVKAPSLGTFYRAPKPGELPFVEVGNAVKPDTEVCLIEVMKLFTSLRAGVSGKIARILAEDGTMIELGDPLFLVELHD